MWATQFHPEKAGRHGLALLPRFVEVPTQNDGFFPCHRFAGRRGRAPRYRVPSPASSAKIYDRAPWEVAARFAAAGASRIHVVDLDAAFTGGPARARVDNHATLKPRASRWRPPGWRSRPAAVCARSTTALDVLFDLGRHAGHPRHRGGQGSGLRRSGLCRALARRHRGGGRRPRRQGGRHRGAGPKDTQADAVYPIRGLAVARRGAVRRRRALHRHRAATACAGPQLDATAPPLAERLAPCPVIASGGAASPRGISTRKNKLIPLDRLLRGPGVVGKALYEGEFTVVLGAAARAAGPGRREGRTRHAL